MITANLAARHVALVCVRMVQLQHFGTVLQFLCLEIAKNVGGMDQPSPDMSRGERKEETAWREK
eukprot:11327358-Prorocentrum_lima.AAC.1